MADDISASIVQLHHQKVPKTAAERARDYRARKAQKKAGLPLGVKSLPPHDVAGRKDAEPRPAVAADQVLVDVSRARGPGSSPERRLSGQQSIRRQLIS